MEQDVYIYLFRGIERLLVVLFGGASIWMGWDLFKRNILSHGDGKAEVGSWKIELRQVGPGVFFAIFGAILLYGSWLSPITPAKDTNGQKNVQQGGVVFLGSQNKTAAKVFSKAVNTLVNEANKKCDKEPGCNLKIQVGIIKQYRDRELLPSMFDKKVLAAASKNMKPEDAPKDIQDQLDEYYKWINTTI